MKTRVICFKDKIISFLFYLFVVLIPSGIIIMFINPEAGLIISLIGVVGAIFIAKTYEYLGKERYNRWLIEIILSDILTEKRYKYIKRFLVGKSLDIGSNKYLEFYSECCDLKPVDNRIKKENAEKLTYKNNSFDTVSLIALLEHLNNPIQALKEVKRITKKRIIILVPYEPWFSFFRLNIPVRSHFWNIYPLLLKNHLGEPIFEKILWNREYLAVYDNFKKINAQYDNYTQRRNLNE